MLLISAQNSQQFFGTHFMHNITQLLQAVDFSDFSSFCFYAKIHSGNKIQLGIRTHFQN